VTESSDAGKGETGESIVATTADATELRSYVALLFADLCDYTALNESCDPEIVVDLRREIEAVAARVVREHGGLITQVYGDGVLAVFGLPSPRANDGRRAVEAAVDLHEAVRRLRRGRDIPPSFEPRMHSGLHGGVVFARRGDAVHGRYDLTGDAVNTASRLCAEAGRDEILVSSAIFSGIEGFFATELHALDLHLKGKRTPLSAYRVLGRSDVRTEYEARSRRGFTAFAGREPELRRLEGVLQETEQSGGKFVVICGPAGIGKSRLADQVRRKAQAKGARVLHGWCESYAGLSPFQPFLQVLRQVFRLTSGVGRDDGARILVSEFEALSVDGEGLRTLVDLLFPAESTSPAPPEQEPLLVEKTVVNLIRALGAHGPVVLTLDDWQWADDGSRQILDGIRRNIGDRPICVLLSMRPPELPDPLLVQEEVIQLGPFSEHESALVIHGLRPQNVNPNVARALHRRSGGNPLFLDELCRSLPVGLEDEQSFEESGLPSTVQGVIQARIAGLKSEEAQLLRVASVIGIEFSLWLLGAACQGPDVNAAIEALPHADIVYRVDPEGTYRFKHGISREVIYESVRIGERRRIHTVVADAIESQCAPSQLADHAETLAYHHRSAGNHVQAARFAELAGEKAMRASALDRARYQYGAALSELEKMPETDDLKRRWLLITSNWAVACAYDPARSQLDHLHRAATYASDLGDKGAQAATHNSLGWIHYSLGDYVDAAEYYRSALSQAEAAGNSKLAEQVWANLGQTFAASGDYEQALVALTRSIDAKRHRSRGTGHGRVAQGFAYAMAGRATVHADRGDFEASDRDMGEALELLKDREHPVEGSVVAHKAIIEIRRGAWQAAIAAAARSRAICERLNSPLVFALSTAFEAFATWMDRKEPGALDRMERGLDLLERRGHSLYLSFGYACFIEALVLAGDVVRARTYVTRALDRRAGGDGLGETAAHRALAKWAAAGGDTAALRIHLRAALEWGVERGAARDMAITRLVAAELCESLTAPTPRDEGELALAEFERWRMDWHAERARKVLTSGRSATP
jgi:class 3 adenylate cyclase/tetratricopeptide (TPR) repeat protein